MENPIQLGPWPVPCRPILLVRLTAQLVAIWITQSKSMDSPVIRQLGEILKVQILCSIMILLSSHNCYSVLKISWLGCCY